MTTKTEVDEGLVSGVEGATPEVRDAVASGNRAVRSAATAMREALRELHDSEDDAWRAYAEEVDWALVHLDAELQVAAAQLRAEQAQTREDLGAALREAAQTWRGKLDDVFVQARLARMDSGDAGHHAIEELAAARHQVESILEHLGHDLGGTLGEARHATLEAVHRVASALRHVRLLPE